MSGGVTAPEIEREAGGNFASLSAADKAGIALRLTGRHLWQSVGETNFPRFVGNILRGFIDPRMSLMGIVHGLGMIVSGGANLFSAAQWKADPLGNLLRSVAEIATGVAVVLGSVAGLATAIAIILTAIAIVGSIFSFGAVGAALAPIIAFCGTVAATVGPLALKAAAVALVLHGLVFIKNLIDAATAQNAAALQNESEQMTEDATNAGGMALAIGMAKAMEVGGKLFRGRFGGSGEGAPPAGAGGPEPVPAGAGGPEPMPAGAGPEPVPAGAGGPEPLPAGSGPEPVPAGAGGPEPVPAGAGSPEPVPTGGGPEPVPAGSGGPEPVPAGGGPEPVPAGAGSPEPVPTGGGPEPVPAGGGPEGPAASGPEQMGTPSGGGPGGLPPDFAPPDDLNFTAEGPPVEIPARPSGEPARVAEAGAGPQDTNVGLPPTPGQGDPTAVDPNLIDLTRSDIRPRPGVTEWNATQPPPPNLRGQDALIINNPRGYDVNVAVVGEAVRPGGHIIIQGRAEVVPGMRPANPNMTRILRQAQRGEMPPGYRVVEIVTDPTVPVGDPATVPRPPDVMGGPFGRTEGGPVSWPNTRIVIERLPEAPPGSATSGGTTPATGSGPGPTPEGG